MLRCSNCGRNATDGRNCAFCGGLLKEVPAQESGSRIKSTLGGVVGAQIQTDAKPGQPYRENLGGANGTPQKTDTQSSSRFRGDLGGASHSPGNAIYSINNTPIWGTPSQSGYKTRKPSDSSGSSQRKKELPLLVIAIASVAVCMVLVGLCLGTLIKSKPRVREQSPRVSNSAPSPNGSNNPAPYVPPTEAPTNPPTEPPTNPPTEASTNPPTEEPTQPITGRYSSIWDYHAAETLPSFMWERTDAVYAVEAGDSHTVALYMDGTVKAVGSNNYGQCNVSNWTDVIQISTLMDVTLGLRLDGTVYATGDNSYGACNVGSWTDIVHVAAGRYHSVGLRSDGTVVTTGNNNYGQCNVGSWRNIQKVYATAGNTMGIQSDGTVLITGSYSNRWTITMPHWENIVDIRLSLSHFLGLSQDGYVYSAAGNNQNQCDVQQWSNIRSIGAGEGFSVAVRTDGNVLFVGSPGDNELNRVDKWGGIWAVACGTQHIVGITETGGLWLCGADSGGNSNIDALNPLFS